MPQATIDTFSKRTAQIEAEAEKQGITDAARKAELGAKIRAKKQKELDAARATQGVGCPTVRRASGGHWLGVPPGNRRPASRYAERKRWRSPSPIAREQESVVPERELKRVALLHGLGSVTPRADRRRVAAPGRDHRRDRRPADGDDARRCKPRSDSSPASRPVVAARSRRWECPPG